MQARLPCGEHRVDGGNNFSRFVRRIERCGAGYRLAHYA